jgi:glycosyltransferase involved in cell wall biosynthesis
MNFKNLKIAYAVTVPITARTALLGQLSYMKSKGHYISLVSSPGSDLDMMASNEGILVQAIPTEREISPIKDLVSFWQYWMYWRKLRPDITNVATPKAGLLAGVAAWLARVPIRIYTLYGLRLETTTGLKRMILLLVEKLSCASAHRVICVSPSLREEAIRLKLCDAKKLVVLGAGSANGVDSKIYAICPPEIEIERLRIELSLPADVPVIGFVGRFTKDKGIAELVKAFKVLRLEFAGLRLLMVGEFENGDPVQEEIRILIQQDSDIILTGVVPDVAPYYHLMTVFALPTYREGFPGVLLEAAASGLPIVSTNATGARDAVLHGKTGFIVNLADVISLTNGIRNILSDLRLAKEYGSEGQKWVKNVFNPVQVWENIEKCYTDLALHQDIRET